MAKPLPFIQLDAKNKLVVTDAARTALSRIDGSIAVCAVAGVYRTGKSYILNQLAGTTANGFGIGSSVQACTKGIWMWGAPLRTPPTATPGAPSHVLLLDTEGLASISQTEGHDAKIFCLAILLSSFFVYNSEKAINNAAIDQLSLVVQLIQKIRVHAGQDDASHDLASVFPRFTWLLRDFQLELADEQGRPMTAQQYLEDCLRAQPGTSAAVKEQNATRAAICRLFSQRDCIALPHPTLGTSLPPDALKKLGGLPLDRLAPDFSRGVLDLKNKLFSSAAPKAVNGTPLNGPMLLQLAEAYVGAINGGALPTISTAWQSVLVMANTKAVDAAIQFYRQSLRAVVAREPPPDGAAWVAEEAAARQAALALFRQHAVGEGTDEHLGTLGGLFDAECAQQRQLIDAKSEALCLRVGGELGGALDRYEEEAAAAATSAARRGAPPPSHAERLPALLRSTLDDYDKRAGGAAKGAGLRQLLDGKLVPLVAKVVRSLEAERGPLLEERARLQSSLDKLAAEHATLGSKHATTEAERSKAVARCDVLEAEARETISAKLRAERAEGERAAEAAALAAERDALNSRLASLDEQREQHASGGRQLAASLASVQGELAAARAELTALQADAARERLAAQAATTQLAAAQHEIAQLRSAAVAAANAASAAAASVGGKKRQRLHESDVDVVEVDAAEDFGAPPPPPPPPVQVAAPSSSSSFAAAAAAVQSPVDPSKLSVPVLQSKLRSKLGNAAKLPKKKDELVKLFVQHCAAA